MSYDTRCGTVCVGVGHCAALHASAKAARCVLVPLIYQSLASAARGARQRTACNRFARHAHHFFSFVQSLHHAHDLAPRSLEARHESSELPAIAGKGQPDDGRAAADGGVQGLVTHLPVDEAEPYGGCRDTCRVLSQLVKLADPNTEIHHFKMVLVVTVMGQLARIQETDGGIVVLNDTCWRQPCGLQECKSTRIGNRGRQPRACYSVCASSSRSSAI